jgi:hypothetical protein
LHFQQNLVPHPTGPATCKSQQSGIQHAEGIQGEFGRTLNTRHVRAASDLVDVSATAFLRASLTPLPFGGFHFVALRIQLATLLAGLPTVANFLA